MAKKRKASSGPSEQKGPRDYNPADARLGPINTFEDIADSEEEYFLNKDQILFENGPKSKKQKRQEEEEKFLENSDEEALVYDDEGSDDDDESDDQDDHKRKASKSAKARRDDGSEGEDGEEEEGDSGWWGSSRKEYYDVDNLETEADAVEEEREARRLQKKKLAKMAESDFIFDEAEWLDPEAGDADQDEVVTEVLKEVEIPADMDPEERYRLLKTRYPEFDYLADELQELQPLLVTIQKQAESQPSKSLAVVKYRILGCYVATLAMYFATLTSPARDATNGTAKALDPSELRDHEVMGTLLVCRDAWKKVEHLKASDSARAASSLLSPPEEPSAIDEEVDVGTELPKKLGKSPAAKKAKAKSKADARKAKAIEESLADLDALVATKKPNKKASVKATARDSDSDFGEEEILDAKAAAEKAARKKSLRFYTSQIVQKANRRADAGRDAGGDNDIPYRERLKDRQARLNAEAENRGKRSAKGADLGEASDEEDNQLANAVRDDEDEYYDMIAARSSKKKEDKAARSAALAAASAADRVVQTEVVGKDGKRKITYQIEKNKGLAPKRNKDARNPRVKKRKAYEQKQKKLRSMKPVFKAQGRGGYAGELTGIKPGLIKSVKL